MLILFGRKNLEGVLFSILHVYGNAQKNTNKNLKTIPLPFIKNEKLRALAIVERINKPM